MQQEANPWASHVYVASHSLCEVSVNWKARETVGHALHPSLEIFFAGKVHYVSKIQVNPFGDQYILIYSAL